MRAGELRGLVLGEAAAVPIVGLAAGLLVGAGTAALLVRALRPIFILHPSLTFPAREIAQLAALAGAATLGSALVATALLRHLKPAELLREA